MVEGKADRRFEPLVRRFASVFRRPVNGGGALAVYRRGEPVVDVWAGYADADGRVPWEADTAAMSFSTTKGVVSTAVHRLVERGVLGYDRPLAADWPAFDVDGKRDLTLRDLLTHKAGLHRVRGLVDSPEELLDHVAMAERVAEQVPRRPQRGGTGYHAITFGWLVAGLVHRVTGRNLAEVVQEEVAGPLGLDGCWIGAPEAEWHRVAELFPPLPHALAFDRIGPRFEASRRMRYFAEALIIDGFERLIFHDPDRRILVTEMPAANGVFTARSLARMYGALANRGTVGGIELLRPETVHELGRVQDRGRDYVLGLPMRWRLGYHQAFTAGRPAPKAFGHYGYGGSGAFADPETGLAVAFVTNRLGSVTTPIGDARLPRLAASALAVGRQLA